MASAKLHGWRLNLVFAVDGFVREGSRGRRGFGFWGSLGSSPGKDAELMFFVLVRCRRVGR